MTIAAIIVLVQVLSSLGMGAMVLRAAGISNDLAWRERAALGFALGMGLLGWFLYFLGVGGLFTEAWLLALLLLGLPGLFFIRWPNTAFSGPPINGITVVLAVLLGIAFGLDFLEALTPAADADSLAYHFALPKQFLAQGGISFVPRAIDGASPMLVQMTYVPVLALGGEAALKLWTLVSGWSAVFLLYTLCRTRLDRNWSLVTALIFSTVPAVVYGAGTGQVEIRNAAFAMASAFAVGRALQTGRLNYALVAGLAAGFFMGGKYLGLIFAGSAGLSVLLQRRWLSAGTVFGVAALGAGFQWYLWNWIHTGDPVFPMLFEWLGNPSLGVWSEAQQQFFRDVFSANESAVSRNLFWLLAYPFKATLDGLPVFESGRTGFGPYALLILPFALGGIWLKRKRITVGPLFAYGLIALLYYVVWFFGGASQRVRHLLPVLPLLLIVLTVAAQRFAASTGIKRPAIAAVILTITIQMGGDAVFSIKSFRYLFGGLSRTSFLEQNVSGYGLVPWLNRNLSAQDRVLVMDRTILFLLDIPYYLAHVTQEDLIDLRPGTNDVRKFASQLDRLGITRVATSRYDPSRKGGSTLSFLTYELERSGCAQKLASLEIKRFRSRTLPQLGQSKSRRVVYAVQPRRCKFPGTNLNAPN